METFQSCLTDINLLKSEIYKKTQDVDVVFGGPPCQGFSVAGKMDPHDPRSKHIWTFAEIVHKFQPKAFLMENVKALGQLKKWEPLREELLQVFREAGYMVNFVILNASEFNVPQARERGFFIGFKGNSIIVPDLIKMIEPYKSYSPTVREALSALDKAGTGNNQSTCKAKITPSQRIKLSLKSYIELLLNFSLLYAPTSPSSWKECAAPTKITEAIYYSGITITTTGHGDITPTNWYPQFLAIL